jgi:hypothetical protein
MVKEFCMKKVTGNAGKKFFLACLAAVLTAGVVPAQELVVGTVQAAFVTGGWTAAFNKKAVATQAYSRLLDAAQQRYGATVDVQDIVWTKGKSVDNQNREIIATGKVVQLSSGEAADGVVHISFVARGWDSLFNKKNIQTQAYIKLLEAAQQRYPGTVDIYDIVWKKSGTVDGENAEIFATGKTTQVSSDGAVSGIVQTSFSAQSWDSACNKKAVNTQAYIKLLEAAQRRYPGAVDITDIVWVSGRNIDHQNSEIIASGKVIQAN